MKKITLTTLLISATLLCRAQTDTSKKVTYTKKEVELVSGNINVLQSVIHKIDMSALLRDKIDSVINVTQGVLVKKYLEVFPVKKEGK